MDQQKLPLLNALIDFSNKKTRSFHVPGHKNGTVFPKSVAEKFQSILDIDVTELSGLDDLHHPKGVIKEAEALAANYYGSKRCFFSIGGSSVGNLAMIMATCEAGDTVLVQRNSHKSIINGLRLAKVRPIFLEPNYNHDAMVASYVDESIILESLRNYPNVKALILTRPNYYGHAASLAEVTKQAHLGGIAVLVDEAHGAHFGHHSSIFPNSAIKYGADVVVQSAHKTLPAMTMCSYIHYNSEGLVDHDKLAYYLQVFQSSSPSYPLMATLDVARYFLASLSEDDLFHTLQQINVFKDLLREIPQVRVIDSDDPLKVIVQTSCILSGFQIQCLLEEEGIFTELADPSNVLFIMPLVIDQNICIVAEKIKSKLSGFSCVQKNRTYKELLGKTVTTLSLSYEEMDNHQIEVVPFGESIGRVVAEPVTPYPPGIPLLLRGEKIDEKHMKQIIRLKEAGAYFQGEDVVSEGIKVFIPKKVRN